MPNGRSGGFLIEKADLKNLLKTFPDDTVVAKVIEGSALKALGETIKAPV